MPAFRKDLFILLVRSNAMKAFDFHFMPGRISFVSRLVVLGILLLGFGVARPSQEVAAAPLGTSHPECAEPPPLTLTLGQQIAIVGQSQLGGFIQIPAGIPGSDSATSLVITCLSLDRTHYLAGMSWRAKCRSEPGHHRPGEFSVWDFVPLHAKRH
jgi:hypothetical protein